MKSRIAFTLLTLLLIGCAKGPAMTSSHTPTPMNEESVVGNGGNDLVPAFRDYVRKYYAKYPGSELLLEIATEHRSRMKDWLSSGDLSLVAVTEVPGGEKEAVGVDPSSGEKVLYLETTYWRETLDTFSLFPEADGERVWQSLVRYATEKGILPENARSQRITLSSDSVLPASLPHFRLEDKVCTEEDLPSLIGTAIEKQLIPRLLGAEALPEEEKQALLRFLREKRFEFEIARASMTDRFGRPVVARIHPGTGVCELHAERWLLFFSPEGELAEEQLKTLLHEILRQARFKKVIRGRDEYFHLSEKLLRT